MELGKNYFVTMKSASVACFTQFSGVGDPANIKRAAYASYIIAPIDDVQVSTMPFGHNLSMFIEADVMQAPSNGLAYYSPKRYCLEGLEVVGGDLRVPEACQKAR